MFHYFPKILICRLNKTVKSVLNSILWHMNCSSVCMGTVKGSEQQPSLVYRVVVLNCLSSKCIGLSPEKHDSISHHPALLEANKTFSYSTQVSL